MRRHVKFQLNDYPGTLIAGYEGAALPIDKAAELVLSDTHHKITRITVDYDDLRPITYTVKEVVTWPWRS